MGNNGQLPLSSAFSHFLSASSSVSSPINSSAYLFPTDYYNVVRRRPSSTKRNSAMNGIQPLTTSEMISALSRTSAAGDVSVLLEIHPRQSGDSFQQQIKKIKKSDDRPRPDKRVRGVTVQV